MAAFVPGFKQDPPSPHLVESRPDLMAVTHRVLSAPSSSDNMPDPAL